MELRHFYKYERLTKVHELLKVHTPQPTVWQGKSYPTPWDFLAEVDALTLLFDGLTTGMQTVVERIGAERVVAVYSNWTTDPLVHVKEIISALPSLVSPEASALEVYGENFTKPVICQKQTPLSNLEWDVEQSQLTVVYTTRLVKLFYYYQDGK